MVVRKKTSRRKPRSKINFVDVKFREFCPRCRRQQIFKEDRAGRFRCSRCNFRDADDW